MTRQKLVLGLAIALITAAAGCTTNPATTEPADTLGAAIPDEAAMAPYMDDSSAIDQGGTNTYSVQQFGRFGYFVSPFTVRDYYSNFLIRRRCRLLWIPGHFLFRPYRIWIRGHFIVVCRRPFPRRRPPIIYPTTRPTYPPTPYPTSTPSMRPSATPYTPTPTPTYTPTPTPTPTYTPTPTPTPTYTPTPTPTPTYTPTPR